MNASCLAIYFSLQYLEAVLVVGVLAPEVHRGVLYGVVAGAALGRGEHGVIPPQLDHLFTQLVRFLLVHSDELLILLDPGVFPLEH